MSWRLLAIVVALTSGAFTASSAPAALAPVPPQERIPLSVVVRDQTGTHADTLFTRLLGTLLERNYIERVQKQTLSITGEWELEVGPNPFRAAAVGDTGNV